MENTNYKHSSEKSYLPQKSTKYKPVTYSSDNVKRILKEAAKAKKRSKKHLFVHRNYVYDMPFLLTRPITLKNNIYSLHMYIISVSTQEQQICLLIPHSIGDIPDFRIYLPKQKSTPTKKLLQLTTSMDRKILNEIFNEVTVSSTYVGCKEFSQEQFEELYKFYVHFLGNIYNITPQKLAATFTHYTGTHQDFSERSYLFLPGKLGKINNSLIQNFLNCMNKTEKPKLLSEKIAELKANPEQLANYLSKSIFEGVHGSHTKYYWVDHIMEPKVQPAKDFIKLVAKYYTCKNYEEILEIFNLTEDLSNKMTVDELLYDHPIEKAEFLAAFRKLDIKNKAITDRSLPIMFIQLPLTPTTFDFINPTKTINSYSSCRKDIVLVNTLSNFPLISVQNLQEYPLNIQDFDLMSKVPSIMTTIERISIANELKQYIKIPSFTEHLVTATNTSSYDQFDNNEVLEMVGDSVLKFLVSLFLILKYPNYDESYMTSKRTKYITNNLLMNLGIKNNLGFYLKTNKKNVAEWRPPYFKTEQKKIGNRMTGKQIADCLEALIGACFITDYNLLYPLKFLENIGLPICDFIINLEIIGQSNMRIPSDFLPQASFLFHQDMNYLALKDSVYFKKLNYKPKSDEIIMKDRATKINRKLLCGSAYKTLNKIMIKTKITDIEYSKLLVYTVLQNFERRYLGYKFKNKSYLVQALNCENIPNHPLLDKNYETLEFFGDSIVEIYVTGNAFLILKNRNVYIDPNLLQNMKISLLTNAFMARLAVIHNFHRYIITENVNVINEINDFIKKVNLKTMYKSFVKHELVVPKVLSDIFEALAGAVLLDGGWPAFHKVFGRIFGPYLQFFCHFFDKMDTNIVEKFHKMALEKYLFIKLLFKIYRDEFVDYKQEIDPITAEYLFRVYKRGEFICVAKGRTAKLAKERACYQACKLCGYI